ncbi:hypothetical protein ACRTEU_24390 [Vibrio alginolyticus]|uniref:hypothetical protein n=1 Tax=Vibrio alginolyticus TaxID=663 RepID=UPI003D7D97AC
MEEIPVSTLKVFGTQSMLLNEISRCIKFARKMDGLESSADRFVKSSLLKQAIVVWYQVFGSRGEGCHWSQVVGKQSIIKPFSRDSILRSLETDLAEWSSYHEDMKRLRDKFIAHFDMDTETDHFPSMDFALSVTEAYRDWLYALFTEYQKSFPVRAGFLNTDEFNALIEREWEEKT